MDRVDRRAELKQSFIEVRGYWNAFWDGLLDLSPDFFEAYLDYSGLPWRSGILEPKVKEFIYIAIDASATHLYEPGLRVHVSNALDYGASKEEIMEVFQLSAIIGMQTMAVGMPALLDCSTPSEPVEPMDSGEEKRELVHRFRERFGYWDQAWEAVLRLNPDFLNSLMSLSGVAYEHGCLQPKVKELINIALNVAVTHLYQPAVDAHVKRARDLGATDKEIFEVFQLTSVLGMHSCTVGVPILLEELSKRSAVD